MAEKEKIRCKVTDTKQEILKMYKAHLEDLNQRAQGSLEIGSDYSPVRADDS